MAFRGDSFKYIYPPDISNLNLILSYSSKFVNSSHQDISTKDIQFTCAEAEPSVQKLIG